MKNASREEDIEISEMYQIGQIHHSNPLTRLMVTILFLRFGTQTNCDHLPVIFATTGCFPSIDNEEYLTGEAGEDNDAKQGERSSPSVKYGTGSVSRMSVKKEEEVKNQEGKGLSALERFRLAAGAAAEASNSPTGSPVKIPPPPSELPRTHGATSKLKLASSRLRTGDSGSLHDSKSDTSHLASHLSNATTHQENNVTHFARSKIFSNDHFPKPSAPPYDQ